MEAGTNEIHLRHRSERTDEQHSLRLHQDAQAVDHLLRMVESLKIDNRQARLRARTEMRAHRPPRVGADHVEAILDQLRAQRRARPAVGREQDDVRRIRPKPDPTYTDTTSGSLAFGGHRARPAESTGRQGDGSTRRRWRAARRVSSSGTRSTARARSAAGDRETGWCAAATAHWRRPRAVSG